MSMPILLNEVSCHVWPADENEGSNCIRSISAALKQVGKLRYKTFLLSDQPIGKQTFGESRTLSSFFSDDSLRDDLRNVLAFANRSPLDDFRELDAEGSECFIGNYSSKGALFARLLKTILLSFPSLPAWSNNEVKAHFHEMEEFSAKITISEIDLPNISLPLHVGLCDEVIKKYWDSETTSPAQLWRERSTLFPNLTFLNRVEPHLVALQGSLAFSQVKQRLFELDSVVSKWDPRRDAFPTWESKVSPEAQNRKRLCMFTADDGVENTYDLHARYTPGAGRIHFRLMPANKRIEIAYIGNKLE